MTKELDRRFRKVGRIKRAWGTDHKPTIRRMEEMMSGLFERGRLDILRLIQDGTYSPLQVYDAYRTNELERLPTAATLAPLKEAYEKWLARKECSESHRRSLHQSLRHLLSGKHSTSSAVGDIPSLLMSLRERIQGKHPRTFNLARAAAQSFARSTSGRNSKLWSDISQVEVLRVTPQRRKNPLTPAEFFALHNALEYPHSAIALFMVGTGMGPSEWWGRWEMRMNCVHIYGTKRAGRDRDVPLIGLPFRPSPHPAYPTFRKALASVSGRKITPYDLRRTYANWLESAGIPRTRRKLYMGHGAKDVTDLYERHEVEAFLIEDAEKLNGYVSSAIDHKRLFLVKKA